MDVFSLQVRTRWNLILKYENQNPFNIVIEVNSLFYFVIILSVMPKYVIYNKKYRLSKELVK